MKPLPLPVRLAAGLVATAVEQVRELPRLVVEFPVTAVSQALQASMRVQQRVTELAIKGDRVLGSLQPLEDKPSWATFDDDDEPRNGASVVTELRPPAMPVRRPASEPLLTDSPEADNPAADPIAARVAPDSTVAADAGPAALPGYPGLTIPQLRARLRTLSVNDLRALLEWEQAHGDRPPFVTMLSNRITTVTEG